MKSRFVLLILLASSVLYSSLAFAEGGPPLVTDDPDVPGNGHWEINLAVTLNYATDESTYELPHFDINYGLGDRIQLKWESGLAMVTQPNVPTAVGWEDSLFGVKVKIIDGGDEGVSLGIYPQLGFRLLSSDNPNVAGPTLYSLLPVEVKKGFGKFVLDAEFGAVLSQTSANGWMYGICASYEFKKRIEGLAEVRSQTGGTTGASELFPPGLLVQIGANIGFNDSVAAILAAGQTFFVPVGELDTTLFYAGAKLTL